MRSHPVVGGFFLVIGLALAVLGALAGSYVPAPFQHLPIPPEVVIPLLLWQLATWALLFGFFFLRPRGRARRGWDRAIPRI